MAEEEGFEPPERSHAQRFSRPPHSTTLPPARGGMPLCMTFCKKRKPLIRLRLILAAIMPSFVVAEWLIARPKTSPHIHRVSTIRW